MKWFLTDNFRTSGTKTFGSVSHFYQNTMDYYERHVIMSGTFF